MQRSKIEWCDSTVNAVRGCTFGCPFCYARRLNGRHLPGYIPDFSKPQFFPERLEALKCKKPKVIFMDSMSDIADWQSEWLETVYKAMAESPQHKYIFLTKRPGNLLAREMVGKLPKAENIWYGTSITGNSDLYPFQSRELYNALLSFEPLLSRISDWNYAFEAISSKSVKWVIIGAQTGPHAKEHQPRREWIEDIANQCRENNVPLFMKNSLSEIWGEPLIQEFPWEVTADA